MISQEKYKDFGIQYFICPQGFNQYSITITKYKDNQKWYFIVMLNTYTNKKAEARKEAREYINNLKEIKWEWNGIKTYNPDTDKITEVELCS